MISGTPASAFETGQPSFAAAAASRKPASSSPGTRPATLSAIFVIPVPGTNVTVAEVWRLSGGVPAPASPCESAIEKHDACAAASSSSGLVSPPGTSARAAHETSIPPRAPLPTESIVPPPLIRSPCQVTEAVRSVAMPIPPVRRDPDRLRGVEHLAQLLLRGPEPAGGAHLRAGAEQRRERAARIGRRDGAGEGRLVGAGDDAGR